MYSFVLERVQSGHPADEIDEELILEEVFELEAAIEAGEVFGQDGLIEEDYLNKDILYFSLNVCLSMALLFRHANLFVKVLLLIL